MAAVSLLLVLGVVVALVVAGVSNNPRHQEILEDIATLHAATGPEITIQQSIFPVVRQEAPRKLSRSFSHLLDFRTLKEASKRTCFPNNAPEVKVRRSIDLIILVNSSCRQIWILVVGRIGY